MAAKHGLVDTARRLADEGYGWRGGAGKCMNQLVTKRGGRARPGPWEAHGQECLWFDAGQSGCPDRIAGRAEVMVGGQGSLAGRKSQVCRIRRQGAFLRQVARTATQVSERGPRKGPIRVELGEGRMAD
jgi:hypothetical protein